MKKLLLIVLALIMCVSSCACGNEAGNKDEKSAESVESIDPMESKKEKLKNAYNECCSGPGSSDYASLGYDGKTLVLDTKPKDGYFKYTSNATAAIMATNIYLGLPSSISEKMSSTRALDGMQSQNCGEYTVSWTYHPDNGLRVIYEVNP
jgi:hypothetical protein